MPPSRFLAVPLEEEEADVRSVGRGVGPELLSPDTDSGGTALAARCGVASVARKGKWSAVPASQRQWAGGVVARHSAAQSAHRETSTAASREGCRARLSRRPR